MGRNKKKAMHASAIVAVFVLGLGMWGGLSSFSAASAQSEGPEFTEEFFLADCKFKAKGENPFFSLQPGYQILLCGEEDGEDIVQLITVLKQKKKITFDSNGETLTVKCRVIEEREWEGGELVEVSRNWFARCKHTNSIYYFGEDVDDYEDGEIVGHEGAWIAGENGALPGLTMPGSFLLGARYMQEIAPGNALDRAEHVAMGLTHTTEAGTFTDCVMIEESSELDGDDLSIKIYCPGVGIIVDEELEIYAYGEKLDVEEILGTDLQGIGEDGEFGGDDDDDDDDDE